MQSQFWNKIAWQPEFVSGFLDYATKLFVIPLIGLNIVMTGITICKQLKGPFLEKNILTFWLIFF